MIYRAIIIAPKQIFITQRVTLPDYFQKNLF